MAGIGEVVAHLKKGGGARREGWDGKGMHIYLNDRMELPEMIIEPNLVLKTAAGTNQPGWVCSQADVLADDWELVDLTVGKQEVLPNPLDTLVQKAAEKMGIPFEEARDRFYNSFQSDPEFEAAFTEVRQEQDVPMEYGESRM